MGNPSVTDYNKAPPPYNLLYTFLLQIVIIKKITFYTFPIFLRKYSEIVVKVDRAVFKCIHPFINL